jgi:hypothetical protein
MYPAGDASKQKGKNKLPASSSASYSTNWRHNKRVVATRSCFPAASTLQSSTLNRLFLPDKHHPVRGSLTPAARIRNYRKAHRIVGCPLARVFRPISKPAYAVADACCIAFHLIFPADLPSLPRIFGFISPITSKSHLPWRPHPIFRIPDTYNRYSRKCKYNPYDRNKR